VEDVDILVAYVSDGFKAATREGAFVDFQPDVLLFCLGDTL